MALVIGIDIGTTSTIGILIDSEGETLALADQPTELFCDRPGWAEEEQHPRSDRRVVAPVGPQR
jgi:xylulokinase